MLLKKLGYDLILELDLLLEGRDLHFILCFSLFAFPAWPGERGATVFKELLLPGVYLRRLQSKFVAKLRNRRLVNQMTLDYR